MKTRNVNGNRNEGLRRSGSELFFSLYGSSVVLFDFEKISELRGVKIDRAKSGSNCAGCSPRYNFEMMTSCLLNPCLPISLFDSLHYDKIFVFARTDKSHCCDP